MAIWQVMNNLSDRPTAVAIGSAELRLGKAIDGGAKPGGGRGDAADAFFASSGIEGAGRYEATDRISGICHVGIMPTREVGSAAA